MIDSLILKNEEKAIFALRSLYKKYGFLPYKMSKFEEYELYVRNKDFLVSDSVITFNDTNGRLLALKPDVTLSIIKNSVYEPGCKQKVYYNENVYRVSGATHQYKEFMQTGLESIGDIDIYDVFEVVYLAAKSLETISDNYVLDISDVAIVSSIIDSCSENKSFKREILKLISEKNKHESIILCEKYGVLKEARDSVTGLIDLYGGISEVMTGLDSLCISPASREAFGKLKVLCELLAKTDVAEHVRIDFSIVNDMKYYNGIVFRGFLRGIYEGVLSGGEYGGLSRRMGKSCDAIGFAIYLDLLEVLENSGNKIDVDVLIIYDTKTEAEILLSEKKKYIDQGMSVSLQRAIPEKLRYRTIVYLNGEDK